MGRGPNILTKIVVFIFGCTWLVRAALLVGFNWACARPARCAPEPEADALRFITFSLTLLLTAAPRRTRRPAESPTFGQRINVANTLGIIF